LPQAQQTLSSLEAIMGDLDIHLETIAERFCREESCYVLRSNREVAHIFSELYAAPPERMAHYLKAKVLELLMLLNDLPQESFSEKRQFFSRSQVITVRAMHDAMIQDLSHHYTLAELSRQFGIAQTSMKLCFKAVYGSSIYQYMKSYRMQTARVLLQDTSHSVTEIAAALGYDNPSKFSEAFKKEYGTSPTLFRNSPSESDVF
jgi:AraC-like DNA-binding protein